MSSGVDIGEHEGEGTAFLEWISLVEAKASQTQQIHFLLFEL